MAEIICNDCGTGAGALAWRCADCGGSLDLVNLPPFDARKIAPNDFSLWRYANMLPVIRRFSLGEGMTPLIPVVIDNYRFHAKLEYLNPSGSFKDRGVATMLNHFAAQDVTSVIDNSSGNAGASLAAYASMAGMVATIYVPATAVASKKRLIRSFGGAIIESHNLPEEIYAAAQRTTYASHAWNPYFVLGQQTAAWEIWEQLGRRAPAAVAAPVGHGGLFLGIYRGFKALRAAGVTDSIPRMIALQSAGVDPIVRGWEAQSARPPAIKRSHSIADGILIDEPVRGAQILAALYETNGFALRVSNEAIQAAQKNLHATGLIAESTSAVTVAALPAIRQRLGDDAALVLALTGSDLKNMGTG